MELDERLARIAALDELARQDETDWESYITAHELRMEIMTEEEDEMKRTIKTRHQTPECAACGKLYDAMVGVNSAGVFRAKVSQGRHWARLKWGF